MLENTFLLCVEFKADVPEQKEEITGILCDNRKRFKTIEDYVRYSVLDKEAFAKETSQHIKEEYANQLSPDDPYQQLYYQYYLQSQSWVEEKIDRLFKVFAHDVVANCNKILRQKSPVHPDFFA